MSNINMLAGEGLYHLAAYEADCARAEDAAQEAATAALFDEISRRSREHLSDIEEKEAAQKAQEAARKQAAQKAMRKAEVRVLKKAQQNTFASLNCFCLAASCTAGLLNQLGVMNTGGTAVITVMATLFFVANSYAYGTRNRKRKKEVVVSE